MSGTLKFLLRLTYSLFLHTQLFIMHVPAYFRYSLQHNLFHAHKLCFHLLFFRQWHIFLLLFFVNFIMCPRNKFLLLSVSIKNVFLKLLLNEKEICSMSTAVLFMMIPEPCNEFGEDSLIYA